MSYLLCSFLGIGCLTGQLEPCGPASYLYQPAACYDHLLWLPAQAYCPQPGDIMLAADPSPGAKLGHRLAFSGGPHHSGIVFALPDGRLAQLEAGPYNTLRLRLMDPLPHWQKYTEHERVWIRKRRIPLTPEQSALLTAFALRQDGKPFALVRLAGQLTLLRSRGPLRTWVVGGPHGDRSRYFCSELVMEACVAAGLLDPACTRPAATYPRDLFFGTSPNPFLRQHLDLESGWYPPARWTSCPLTLPSEE
jgi:hypothetical protein